MMNELIMVLMAMNLQTVHLSFDDGPHPKYTKEILTILREEKIKANFFLVGQKVNENNELVKQIVSEGHDIGGHSMTHKELTKIPLSQAKSEIFDSMTLVNKYQKTNLFRFPYGSFNSVLDAYVKSLGYRNIYWDVDTTDWKYTDKDVIYKKFRVRIGHAPDGSIVLMHDIHPQTVEVLPSIIKYLKYNNIAIKKID